MNRLAWWPDGLTVEGLLNDISTSQSLFKKSTMKEQTLYQQAARAVYHAALDEGAIEMPTNAEAILEELRNAWKGKNVKRMTPTMSILLPHLQALKYLLYECDTLSPANVCKAHKLMMEACLDNAGKWRTTKAHAGLRTFADPEGISKAMSKALDLMTYSETDPFQLAAHIFYKVVHCIHPFTDGNGRIGRMLVAWILLKKDVVAFPTPIHNGHRKSRKHYELAISGFSRLSDPYHTMRLYLIECVHKSWVNWVQRA